MLAHVAERFNGVGTAQLKSVGYHNLLQLRLGARVSQTVGCGLYVLKCL